MDTPFVNHLPVLNYVNLYEHLEKHLEPKRLAHVYGVTQTAVALAALNSVNEESALQAALLHDSAKYLKAPELMAEMEKAGRAPVGEDLEHPQIWHGTVAAIWGPEKFGIKDPHVLQAVDAHTLGVPYPSPLLQVLMAADGTEPTRNFPEADHFRQLVRENLKSGLKALIERKINLMKNERKVHSRVFSTLESLEL